MSRLRPVVLSLMFCGTTLAAQSGTSAHDPASTPFYAGLTATVIPIAIGIAMMRAGRMDFEQGPASAGFLLASGGLLLGPAVGDWVGGLSGRGFARFGLRSVAWLGGLGAGYAISYNGSDPAGSGVLLGALGIATGLAIWDLATLPSGVRRNRAKSISLVPTVRPESHALGVVVHFAF